MKIIEAQVKKIIDLPRDIINDNERQRRVYDTEGISPSILSRQDSPKILQLGNINPGETGQSGIVYDQNGISPTLDTCQGGNRMPKIVEPLIVASRGRNPQNPSDRTPGNYVEQRLEPNSQGICNTLTSVQKDNLVLEPAILCNKRTEYGKAIRKKYESGEIQESRHNMTELQPRDDGISNTLTTVQKDNLLLEPTIKIKQATKDGYIDCKLGGVADLSYPTSKTRQGRVQDNGDTCPTLTASETGICRIETPYRIRKLTPLECWRLMDFTDEDFYKAKFVIEIEEKQDFIEQNEAKVNKILNSSLPESKKMYNIKNLSVKIKERTSNTQLYKQAGNSIVRAVLMAIFKQMLVSK